MESKVLIVAHTFPPAAGVGGRRWAKFSKYLNQNNVIPFILTANSGSGDSLWTEDIKSIKNIFFYKNRFPEIISKTHLNFIDKIRYKLALFIIKFFAKGNYYDRVVFDRDQIIRQIDGLLKQHSINDLIVSGAPFNLLYYAAIYKQKNPKINFIADIRDPWTWGQNYGITLIEDRRKLVEKEKEALVLKVADTILVPTGIMYDHLVKNYPEAACKIKVLAHGFDSDSIRPREVPFRFTPKQVKIAYIGELYDHIGHYFGSIADAMQNENSPFLIDFYSRTDRYKEIFTERSLVGTKVNYHPLIKSADLFERLKEYDFILIIHPTFAKDYISTKFYEILYSRTPIIFIAEQGITSDFIQETGSGIYLSIDQISEFFNSDQMVSKFIYQDYKDINKFEMNFMTKNTLIDCLSYKPHSS